MKAVIAALVLVPAIASADVVVMTGAPGAGQPVAQPFVPAPPAKQKDGLDARQDTVAANRGVAAPTALTVPAGEIELTLQTIIVGGLAGLNVGVTSSTEAWIEGATPFFDFDEGDHPFEIGAGIKQSLIRSSRFALAATGSMRRFSGGGSDKLLSLGAVGTLCVDDGCGVQLSGSFSRVFGFHESDYDDNGPGENVITLSASVGSKITRFLIEGMTMGDDDDGSVVFLGVRFGGSTYAVDLALVRPLEEDLDDIPGVPWVGFSARL